MHDHRCTIVLRLLESLPKGTDIVPVDRADVLDVEVGVQRLVVGEPAEEAMKPPAHTSIDRPARTTEFIEELLTAAVQRAVRLAGADVVEVARHPADGRSVGAAVVIDHDDEFAIVVVADVVERLPGHATRESPVADNGYHVSIALPGHRE